LATARTGNDPPVMTMLPPRRHAQLHLLFVALTVLVCGGLLAAGALVPAPPAALPALILTGIGMPMLAAAELPAALAVLRDRAHRIPHPLDEDTVDVMLAHLDLLPETEHPLGL
jgi:hypothetical protein